MTFDLEKAKNTEHIKFSSIQRRTDFAWIYVARKVTMCLSVPHETVNTTISIWPPWNSKYNNEFFMGIVAFDKIDIWPDILVLLHIVYIGPKFLNTFSLQIHVNTDYHYGLNLPGLKSPPWKQ